MTATTTDRKVRRGDPEVINYPMAVENIPSGVLLCRNAAGYVENATDAASKIFAGVSNEAKDNSAGSAGDLRIDALRWGDTFQFAFSGSIALTDVGLKAYVIDNQTVGLVGTANNDILVGVIVKVDLTNSLVFVDVSKSDV